jgi:molybdopterin/thiamine biosynthesis adenylyltransferase
VPLSKHELDLYSRQLGVPGWGVDGQERLKAAHAFVAGVGGLGCAAAVYLACAGIGKLTICDSDQIERSNLNRQFLYGMRDIGRPKVELAAARLRALNPLIEIVPLPIEIDHGNAASLIGGASIVVDGLDNLETRVVVNRACISERIPMVYGAVSELTGHVTFLNPPETPCLECFVSQKPPAVDPGIPGCTPGVVGALQAMEAIKHLTGVGDVLAGRLLVLEGGEPRTDVIEIEKDPGCPACRGLS